MAKDKKTKGYKLPQVSDNTLSMQIYKPKVYNERCLIFSFDKFDRAHNLFNLGDVPFEWYLSLLDCLKEVSNIEAVNLKGGKFDLHPVDWDNANASPPYADDQYEYWQFRLCKSKGRVVGIRIENCFYVVWLDAHHNLSDSEGYGKITYHSVPQTPYELLESQYNSLQEEFNKLTSDYEIMSSSCDNCQYKPAEYAL